MRASKTDQPHYVAAQGENDTMTFATDAPESPVAVFALIEALVGHDNRLLVEPSEVDKRKSVLGDVFVRLLRGRTRLS